MTREACDVKQAEIRASVVDRRQKKELEAQAQTIQNSLGRLWKIETPNGTLSYLWGTYHSSSPWVTKLPEELSQAIQSTDFTALEFDPIFKSRRKLETFYKSDQIYAGSREKPSYDDIDVKVVSWIKSRLISLGFREPKLADFKPYGLIQNLLSDPCDDFSNGTLPIQDNLIALIAREHRKSVIGLQELEDLQNHLNAKQNRNVSGAVIDLYASSLNPDLLINDERATNFQLYREGRVGELMVREKKQAFGFFGSERGREILRLVDGYLINERNLLFLDKIKSKLLTESGVIAVGSFHLPGKSGLISMLRSEGFKVTRILTGDELETY